MIHINQARPTGRPNSLNMRGVIVSYSQPIRFAILNSEHAQSDRKSVNRGLPVLDLPRGRDILVLTKISAGLWGRECSRFRFHYSQRITHSAFDFCNTILNTVEPRYNEVSRYRKNCSLWRGLRYSEDSVITNYVVNNKNIRYSGVTKVNNVIIHHSEQSTDLHVNSYI